MIDIEKLHQMVWSFRTETQHVFPVPNRLDSLYFAYTEAGEALDAYLRQNGDYKRNRDRQHNVEREFAQCVFMLMTAYGPNPWRGLYWQEPTPPKIGFVCYQVSRAMQFGDGVSIACAVRAICQYVPTIEDELAAALDALAAKHLSVTPVTEVSHD